MLSLLFEIPKSNIASSKSGPSIFFSKFLLIFDFISSKVGSFLFTTIFGFILKPPLAN